MEHAAGCPGSRATFHAVRSRSTRAQFVVGTVLLVSPWLLGACGSAPSASVGTEVTPTDYVTLPPPTTTIPPTTTQPPATGSVITSEATYVVVAGDYPFQVAALFGVDFEAFVALNGWTIDDGVVPEWPAPGTTIRIPAGAIVPGGPSVLVPVPTTTIAPLPAGVTGASTPSDIAEGPDGSTVADTTTTVNDGVGCGTYTVVAGDYLGRVATKLDTTVDALAEANADTDGYGAFYVGLAINVPC